MRIAVGGFQHETNTFAPTRASFELFEREDAWPGLSSGQTVFTATADRNIPTFGFATRARELGHDLVGLVWANASPSAYVTEDAFERIAGMMVDALREALPVDAIYLELHGAMVTEHFEDGEGELLRRVREVVGPDMPIVASLDLHSNTTPDMIAHADALVAYKTYPHVDMAETGARSADVLDHILREGKPAKAFRQLPFLIPINWQCSLIEPARSIYRRVDELEAASVSASFTPGFPPADILHSRPAVFAYAQTQGAADSAAEELLRLVADSEPRFAGKLWEPEAAIAEASRIAEAKERPVVIADTQDNPGGGGDGDTTGMLAALAALRPARATIGPICDASLAGHAHELGQGARFEAAIGGRSGWPGDGPFVHRVVVEALSDGRFLAKGPMYRGNHMNLGPMALLRLDETDVRMVVCSRKTQAADREIFRHIGLVPEEQRILVLKSSVHFRADFQEIAADVLVARAPGPVIADPTELPYRRLAKGLRLGPLGPPFEG